ncbi:MAG: hypothetical protein KGH93_01560 [Patescibacteria group bacterium]|nr:hypothetical protein [Patescibacteria group bacterium]MDE1945868.1 hypothetical protein [Patescibacteria group bacterium]
MKKSFKAFVLYIATAVSDLANKSGITCFCKGKHTFKKIEVAAHGVFAPCELCGTELIDAKSSLEYKAFIQGKGW